MNKNKTTLIILIAVIAVAIMYYFSALNTKPIPLPSNKETSNINGFDSKNASFKIDGVKVELKNGVSQTYTLPNSASKITTRYFGNDAKGDLNKDGQDDVVFLVTQDQGGSGLFYYAVAAIKTADGYKTTNAFFIGDRIAPQNNQIISSDGEIHINYAERNPGEPMTTSPSLGAVKLLRVTPDLRLVGLMSE